MSAATSSSETGYARPYLATLIRSCWLAMATAGALLNLSSYAVAANCIVGPTPVNPSSPYAEFHWENHCNATGKIYWTRRGSRGSLETGEWVASRCDASQGAQYFKGEYSFNIEIDPNAKRCDVVMEKRKLSNPDNDSKNPAFAPKTTSNPAPSLSQGSVSGSQNMECYSDTQACHKACMNAGEASPLLLQCSRECQQNATENRGFCFRRFGPDKGTNVRPTGIDKKGASTGKFQSDLQEAKRKSKDADEINKSTRSQVDEEDEDRNTDVRLERERFDRDLRIQEQRKARIQRELNEEAEQTAPYPSLIGPGYNGTNQQRRGSSSGNNYRPSYGPPASGYRAPPPPPSPPPRSSGGASRSCSGPYACAVK